MVLYGPSMSGLSDEDQMAGRICMSEMLGPEVLDDQERIFCVLQLPISNDGIVRDDISGHAQTSCSVVSSYVVCDKPEDRRECAGTSTDSWIGKLPDCVDLASQIEACYGTARPRRSERARGSG